MNNESSEHIENSGEARQPGMPTDPSPAVPVPAATAVEVAGRPGLDPTRYGDWEKNGRCIDF